MLLLFVVCWVPVPCGCAADGNIYVNKQISIAELSPREKRDAINEVKILASLDSEVPLAPPFIAQPSFVAEDVLRQTERKGDEDEGEDEVCVCV